MRIAPSILALGLLALVSAVMPYAAGVTHQADDARVRRIRWQDAAPLHGHLEARGFSAAEFSARIDRLAADNVERVRLGDLDHLVFYLLQSKQFTARPAIEPALSARALVEGLPAPAREAFSSNPASARDRVSNDVRARVAALLRAFEKPRGDRRLTYFARLLAETTPGDARAREQTLIDQYMRVMRFVYEKEFGSGRASATAAASLYRARGLSTDTAIEAGFLVSQGLGVLRALEPARRVRRVLIVGAGLDLAPRTALLESAPPQSYQPWAVLDALVSAGLSSLDDVQIVAADINPRVVDHLRGVGAAPPQLVLLTGIGDDGQVALARDYREYFASLGRSIGRVEEPARREAGVARVPSGRLYKRLQVSQEAARDVRAERLDVVTERLAGEPFDLVIATNVLPYFDDDALLLALSNIAAMLEDEGVFLHNEARPALHEFATALGLPSSQSRHAVIATVQGAPPLGDSVWLHVRRKPAVR